MNFVPYINFLWFDKLMTDLFRNLTFFSTNNLVEFFASKKVLKMAYLSSKKFVELCIWLIDV